MTTTTTNLPQHDQGTTLPTGTQSVRIITNGVARDLLSAWDLTDAEREDLDITADTEGEYVRYRGTVYPVSDFSTSWGVSRDSGMPHAFRDWDGYLSDSFFSGVVIRYVRDGSWSRVILGTFYA